ncbi:hypothetical protein GCM10009605_19660 [Nocardiopsis composta]
MGRQRPQHTLARLGARTADPALAVRRPPSPDTIRRVLIALPPTHLTTLACAEDLSVLIVKKMRKKASHIFTDSSLFYPSCLPVFEDIDEIFPKKELKEIFLFGHHQGCQYFFFKRGETGEWVRTDLTPVRDECIAVSFEELLEKEIEAARKIFCNPPEGCWQPSGKQHSIWIGGDERTAQRLTLDILVLGRGEQRAVQGTQRSRVGKARRAGDQRKSVPGDFSLKLQGVEARKTQDSLIDLALSFHGALSQVAMDGSSYVDFLGEPGRIILSLKDESLNLRIQPGGGFAEVPFIHLYSEVCNFQRDLLDTLTAAPPESVRSACLEGRSRCGAMRE